MRADKKKFSTRLMAALMAGTLAAGMMGMNVSAAGVYSGNPITTIPVTKNVLTDGNTMAPNTTFEFEVAVADPSCPRFYPDSDFGPDSGSGPVCSGLFCPDPYSGPCSDPDFCPGSAGPADASARGAGFRGPGHCRDSGAGRSCKVRCCWHNPEH